MNTVDWSTIGSNVFSMAVGAAGLYAALVRPQREALKSAMAQLEEFKDARIAETLARHSTKISEIERAHIDCQVKQIPSFLTRRDLETSEKNRDAKLNEIETTLGQHGHILTGLDERSKNTKGWLEKLDDRLEDVSRGLANLAGRSGV